MKKRSSGILCHITSRPSPFDIGDFGVAARLANMTMRYDRAR
ncbi:hypothetical protein [Geomonas agri]|nr:hypothetical protein [Geomonas agri]